MKLNLKFITALAYFMISLSSESFAQKKIINYDFQTNSLDREYLYFKEHFQIKGSAQFYNFKFDKVKVNIYRTMQGDPKEINKVKHLIKPIEIPLQASETTEIKSKKIIKDEKGVYKFETIYIGKDKEDKSSLKTVHKSLSNKEVKRYESEIALNSEISEEVISFDWIRQNPSEEFFLVDISAYLDFNWVYVIELEFNGKETNTETKSNEVAIKDYTCRVNPCVNKSITASGDVNIITTFTSVSTNTLMANLSETVTTISEKKITRGRSFHRAYDVETVQSRFSVTTGFGGIYLGNPKKAPTEVEFLNFVAMQYHFKRVFPTQDEPYILKGSKWSAGFGLLTTGLKYQDKPLSGFGAGANLKPILCLGYDAGKFIGLCAGIIAFKQDAGLATTTRKHFAVAPFVTLNLSTEVINLFKTSNALPEPNK